MSTELQLRLPQQGQRAVERSDPAAVSVDERRDPDALLYAAESLSPETKRKYRKACQDFMAWCSQVGRNAFPATPQTLEAFAAKLAKEGKAAATIRLSLAAVRTAHARGGENRPDLTLAGAVIEGYERTDAPPPKETKPIMLPELRAMVDECVADECVIRGLRDRSILELGVAIMSRRSELCGLDIEHIKIVVRGLQVTIAKSKTDQKRKGVTTMVPYSDALPAVQSTIAYIEALAAVGVTSGPLYRAVDRWGNVKGAPEGRWGGPGIGGNGRMDGSSIELIIANRAHQAWLRNPGVIEDPSEIKPHGQRAGGATEAYAAGADILSIARQGRWGDRSPVVFRYIKDQDKWIRNPIAKLDRAMEHA